MKKTSNCFEHDGCNGCVHEDLLENEFPCDKCQGNTSNEEEKAIRLDYYREKSDIAANVYHPTHYNNSNRKECWDEMIEVFGADAVVIFDCLSAYKYDYRAGEKDGNPAEQDIAKIDNYINHASSFDKLSSYAKFVVSKAKEVLSKN